MVFSSQLFLFGFLPVALLVLAAARLGPRALRQGLLIAFSYAFYGWSNPPFMALLALSTLVDFACGWIVATRQPGASAEPDGRLPLCPVEGERSRSQHIAVAVSVCSNLALLGFFKYANLAAESDESLTQLFGGDAPTWVQTLRITLPLGISFYTFQSLSYTVDVYRGHARATRSLLDFAAYVSLFPQLVAGPIVRFSEVADQLRRPRFDAGRTSRGIALFCLGLSKKVLLANPAGEIADLCFGAGSLSMLDAWLGLLAYAFQIYFDFSGYTDMAIGLGLLLGFSFPRNFDAPYSSRSITEFWRRWHISLSSFLRDYLYLPLGGNRLGAARTYVNLFVVMLLGGLWHGASWNFVAWGAFHGVLLAAERANGRRALWHFLPAPAQTAATFVAVALAWVPFRAADGWSSLQYFGHLFGVGELTESAPLVAGAVRQPFALAWLTTTAAITWGAPQAWEWSQRLTPLRAAWLLLLLWTSTAMLLTQQFNPFIYFIF